MGDLNIEGDHCTWFILPTHCSRVLFQKSPDGQAQPDISDAGIANSGTVPIGQGLHSCWPVEARYSLTPHSEIWQKYSNSRIYCKRQIKAYNYGFIVDLHVISSKVVILDD